MTRDARRPRGLRSPSRSRDVRCFSKPSCTAAKPAFALSVTASTGFGSAAITVQGTCSPFSLKIWVMPSFLPIMPIMFQRGTGQGTGDGGQRSGDGDVPRALFAVPRSSLHLDFHVHARRQIQLGEGVDRLRARVENVDDAFVRLQLELLA